MTTLPLSVERDLRDRLDFSRAVHCGRDVELSGYIGQSSLAAVVDWFGMRPMDRDLAAPKRKAKRPRNWHKRGVPRSEASKVKQREAMQRFYAKKHQQTTEAETVC